MSVPNEKDKKTLWGKIWKGIKYTGIGAFAAYGAWSLITDVSEWQLIKERKIATLLKATTYNIGSHSLPHYVLKRNISRVYILRKSFEGLEEKASILYDNLKGKKSDRKTRQYAEPPDMILSEIYRIKRPEETKK